MEKLSEEESESELEKKGSSSTMREKWKKAFKKMKKHRFGSSVDEYSSGSESQTDQGSKGGRCKICKSKSKCSHLAASEEEVHNTKRGWMNQKSFTKSLSTEPPTEEEGEVDPVYELLKNASSLRAATSRTVSESTSNEQINIQNKDIQPPAATAVETDKKKKKKKITQRSQSMFQEKYESDAPISQEFSTSVPDLHNAYTADVAEYDSFHPTQHLHLLSHSTAESTSTDDKQSGSTAVPDVFRSRLINVKGGSLDIPDENEKSISSASSASPLGGSPRASHRQSAGVYVVTRDFSAHEYDEIDLYAGDKLIVTDSSDLQWWKGKLVGGQVGYFPSACVMRVYSGEKVVQVTHSLQLNDAGYNIKLSREQIILQLSEDEEGMAVIRVSEKEVKCPIRYLRTLWST